VAASQAADKAAGLSVPVIDEVNAPLFLPPPGALEHLAASCHVRCATCKVDMSTHIFTERFQLIFSQVLRFLDFLDPLVQVNGHLCWLCPC